MVEKTKETYSLNKQVWISSIKQAVKILVICLLVMFYLAAISFFMFPRASAKVCNFLGLTKAEEASYVQAYENTGAIEDLYNLVLFEQQHEEYEKELYYINVLMKFDDYEEFCERLDASAIADFKNYQKYMISYVGDTNAYLVNRKLKCMYFLNSKNSYENRSNSVAEYVRIQLKSGNDTETSFNTFVTLVLNDATLTETQKIETLNTFLNLTSTENLDETSLLLKNRIENLNNKYSDAVKVENKIIIQNALVKLYKAKYQMMEKIGAEESELIQIEQSYEEAVEEYNILVKY